eukprot:CAMPEP_0194099680 /NCGR_PEP_ID=MMETSP0150-20130528/786_1 /TAXON_ID=122233 /ORGANISM="Chaetoceros debilis, Strain MM31A-1" /LENGTH=779 /DNA_ID=CAMNT_0038785915 /DNA_START=94 /DNA_END=2433 /DNA_ORIENTATION=+
MESKGGKCQAGKEAVTAPTKDQRTLTNASSLFHVAIWRIIFFLILTFTEWDGALALSPYDNGNGPGAFGNPVVNSWFAYNHMEWVADIHSSMMAQSQNIPWIKIGYTLLFFATFGKEIGMPTALWRFQTSVYTILYSLRFFSRAQNFTNHNYLYVLLLVLTIFSGGGYIHVRFSKKSKSLISEISACEACKLAMRFQFAVVYFYASLWKLHGDWLSGSICRNIFLNLEESGKARGIPWAKIEAEYLGNIFQIVAISGLLLDFSMFVTLTFSKPKPSSTLRFMIYTLFFHMNTMFMMSKLIGYSFPATCIAALPVFSPMRRTFTLGGETQEHVGFDHSLLKWIKLYTCQLFQCRGSKTENGQVEKKSYLPPKYMLLFVLAWTTWQFLFPLSMVNGQVEKKSYLPPKYMLFFVLAWTTWQFLFPLQMFNGQVDKKSYLPPKYMLLFVLAWSTWQFLFPLRMFIASDNFPHTRLGYRYSWTMMLHTSNNIIQRHDDNPSGLILHYMSPTCFSNDDKRPDQFMPRSVYAGPDSEHPMQDGRTVPFYNGMDIRQNLMLGIMPAHFAARIAKSIGDNIDNIVNGADTCSQVGVAGQAKMGMHYVYFGKLNNRGAYCRVVDPTVDIAKTGRVQALLPFWRKVLYSLIDQRPPGHEFMLKKGIGSLKQEALTVKANMEKASNQTVEMLSDRAACLQRKPIWFKPLLKTYTIIPVRIPEGMQLELKIGQPPDGKSFTREPLKLREPYHVSTTSLEIGLTGRKIRQTCGETDVEDVLIAIVYKEEKSSV